MPFQNGNISSVDQLSLNQGGKPLFLQKRFLRNDRLVYMLMAEKNITPNGRNEDMVIQDFQKEFTLENLLATLSLT